MVKHTVLLIDKMSKIRKKPFACIFCEKRFEGSAHLMSHINAHTGAKPFKCVYCDKKFGDGSNMERHVRTIHTGVRRFPYQNSSEASSRQEKHLKRQTQTRCGVILNKADGGGTTNKNSKSLPIAHVQDKMTKEIIKK